MTYAAHADSTGSGQAFRLRIAVYAAIASSVVLAWAALWLMAAEHAENGELGTLGPGMAALVPILGVFGPDMGRPDSLWSDICRAIVLTGDVAPVGLWTVPQVFVAMLMWIVMAVGMMLPTAAPAIAVYTDINLAARAKGMTGTSPMMFTVGYLAVWIVLGAAGSVIQWGFSRGIAAHVPLMDALPVLGGIVLITAGMYQWSSLKEICLTQCRSPMRFFLTRWQDGGGGALRMGMRHGLYCVGCCWALMSLMFVGGTMNLVWMAVLTIIMLLEKMLPHGRVFGRSVGVILIIWGASLLITEAL